MAINAEVIQNQLTISDAQATDNATYMDTGGVYTALPDQVATTDIDRFFTWAKIKNYIAHWLGIKELVIRGGITYVPNMVNQISQAVFSTGIKAQTMNDVGTVNAIFLTPTAGPNGPLLPSTLNSLVGAIFEFECSTYNTSGSVGITIGQTNTTPIGSSNLVTRAGAGPEIGEIRGFCRVLYTGTSFMLLSASESIERTGLTTNINYEMTRYRKHAYFSYSSLTSSAVVSLFPGIGCTLENRVTVVNNDAVYKIGVTGGGRNYELYPGEAATFVWRAGYLVWASPGWETRWSGLFLQTSPTPLDVATNFIDGVSRPLLTGDIIRMWGNDNVDGVSGAGLSAQMTINSVNLSRSSPNALSITAYFEWSGASKAFTFGPNWPSAIRAQVWQPGV